MNVMKTILCSLGFLGLGLATHSNAQGPPPRGPVPVGGESMNKPTLAADESERKILAVLDDLRANQSQGMMNVPPDDGRMLRLLTETTGAKHVVEIGTSNGYSGIWFCLALRKTGGKLTTFDIDEGRFKLATENFKRAGVSELVTQVFGDAHQKVADLAGPIDVLFLDADKEGYIDYLKQLLPKVKPGGLILAHNTTNAGPAMADYLKAITTDPKLETLFVNAGQRGLAITMVKR